MRRVRIRNGFGESARCNLKPLAGHLVDSCWRSQAIAKCWLVHVPPQRTGAARSRVRCTSGVGMTTGR